LSQASEDLLGLENRCLLVTGARGGIGAAVAQRLSGAGARVLEVDLPGVVGAQEGDAYPCDLGHPEAVRALFAELRRSTPRLDGIVHCAGVTRDGVLWKLDDEQWGEVLRSNLDAAFYLLREAVPLMREHGGTITLLSSINGERGRFGQANYAASKAGLIGLARTAARELGAFGIRVNVLSPGLVRTGLTEGLPPEALERSLAESVLGRLGEPDDVARVALFLASELSRHVTGQVLRVDGGQLIG